jgi:hypothetical protein
LRRGRAARFFGDFDLAAGVPVGVVVTFSDTPVSGGTPAAGATGSSISDIGRIAAAHHDV